jgi:hypothetical protein
LSVDGKALIAIFFQKIARLQPFLDVSIQNKGLLIISQAINPGSPSLTGL